MRCLSCDSVICGVDKNHEYIIHTDYVALASQHCVVIPTPHTTFTAHYCHTTVTSRPCDMADGALVAVATQQNLVEFVQGAESEGVRGTQRRAVIDKLTQRRQVNHTSRAHYPLAHYRKERKGDFNF